MADVVATTPHRHRKQRLGWAVAVALTIVIASSRSAVAAPDIQNIDKVVHFAVYGLLATLMCRLGTGWRAAAWAVLATSVFGATDEVHQMFVPGRSSEVGDWLADTTGGMLAVSLYTGWHGYRQLLEWVVWSRKRISVPAPRSDG